MHEHTLGAFWTHQKEPSHHHHHPHMKVNKPLGRLLTILKRKKGNGGGGLENF
jgi:hypothetical protein